MRGSSWHAPHEYLAYPGGIPKPGAGDGFDTVMGPHLRPMADLVMGQHAMRSPAIGVQHGSSFAALVPYLLGTGSTGRSASSNHPVTSASSWTWTSRDQRVDGAVLRFGWATLEWTFSLWRVEEGYFCRKLEEPASRSTVRLAYDLLLDAAAPAQGMIASAQQLLWSAVSRPRYFTQSTLPQTQPADRAFDDAWSWGHQLYEERTVHAHRWARSGWSRESPPDAMFTTWFNSLRSSYGIAANGRSRGDHRLWQQGRAALSLLLSAPHDHGAFHHRQVRHGSGLSGSGATKISRTRCRGGRPATTPSTWAGPPTGSCGGIRISARSLPRLTSPASMGSSCSASSWTAARSPPGCG